MGVVYPSAPSVNPVPPPPRQLYTIAGGRGRQLNDETRAVYDAGGPAKPAPAKAASGPYVKAPVSVLTDRRLSERARVLYLLLLDHHGARGCFPGRALLAEEVGTSTDGIDRAMSMSGCSSACWGSRSSSSPTGRP